MARGRKQGGELAPAGPGASACPLCGEVVPVGEDGRCDLGHRVRQPRTNATEPLSHVDVVDRAVAVPAAGVAGPAAAGLAAADTMRLDDTQDEPVDIAPLDADSQTDADPASTGDTDPADDRGTDPADDRGTADGGDVDFSGELDW